MPTIRLASDDDMRAITSQTLDRIKLLPHVDIPTAEPDVMRSWGVAKATGDGSVAVMRSIKAAIDPHGLMNPGKVFDA